MIPTLFGVTIVSFCIMQVAPGDPLQSRLSSGGAAGQSSQTREAYLIQKRDLKLDRPLVVNFNYFRDFTSDVRIAAHFRSRTFKELTAELETLAEDAEDDESRARLKVLRRLDIGDFDEKLNPPDLSPSELEASGLTAEQWEQNKHETRAGLARAVEGFLQIWCEDIGAHAVPAAMELLQDEASDRRLKIGVIRCLSSMVANPFVYTYSRHPTDAQTDSITGTWRSLWKSQQGEFAEIDPDRDEVLARRLEQMAEMQSRADMFRELEQFDRDDAPFFADVLLGDSTLQQKVIAAEFLSLYTSKRLRVDVSIQATQQDVDEVSADWLSHYDVRRANYHPSFGTRLWSVVADTQYAHMVVRLVTFNFGRSTLKTREPVSEKIWNGLVVSAPLMFMAQLFIYLVAVPLGMICAVKRRQWADRIISLVLYFLYSIPPYVAGMLLLLFLCYGNYAKWFPMERLHSDNADELTTAAYLLDYLWHCLLPVTCLALFSLAAMAMYSRSAMLDVLGQDYIRTARAKGLSENTVVIKHAFRNGLIPIITLFSTFLPAMLGGSVLIEVIFGIPGMGRLGFNSITQKDYPTLMALIYVNAIVVMISILLTDLLYVFVDPRISFEGQAQS